eukprot:676287_1
MEQGLVTVYSLHGWGCCGAKGVVARDATSCGNHTSNTQNGHISISFTNASIKPTSYTWRHDGNGGYYPRNWDLEASNDNVTWDILRRHVNDENHGINSVQTSHTWTITNCNKYYKMFRFKITGKDSSG